MATPRVTRSAATMTGAVVLALICSCASPRVAFKKDFDFSGIKTIRVGDFSSSARQPNSGSVVANEFIRQLLASGYNVVTSAADKADATLEGSVTEYLPNQRFLVQSEEGNPRDHRQVVVTYPPVELSGTSVYNTGAAFGVGEGSQVIVSNATVGVSAYLKDASTGEVVWSDAYTYEGLDLNTAMEGTVRSLLHSLPMKAQ